MADDLGEKTEEPTPKRLADAREEGNIAKSTDMAAAVLLLGVTIMLWLSMMPMLGDLKIYMQRTLGDLSVNELVQSESLAQVSSDGFWTSIRILGPMLLIAWLLAWVSYFFQVGWLFSSKAIAPSLNKLNPISGFKRIFGIQAIVKATLDSAKVGIVVLVVVMTIGMMYEKIVLLPNLTMMQALGVIGWMLFDLALRIVAVLLMLGVIDFVYQKWKHKRDLKMSKTEIKEELKQTEGDPETRKRRMRIQQQIAMQRLGTDVPKADVIVTNPEHISVAIQYDPDSMHTPKVVAKGQEMIALRIRQIAMKHNIPIVERKPLARLLYKSVDVGQEVPPSVYQAIAEILAYVYRLSGRVPA